MNAARAEEEEKVATAIGQSRADQSRGDMV